MKLLQNAYTRRAAFAALLFSGLIGTVAVGPTPTLRFGMDASRLDAIPARMQSFVDAGKAAGIVTLVQRHGSLAHLNAVGMQNIEENKPMRPDSIFQIMSMTKPFTAVAVMMLVEEGKI